MIKRIKRLTYLFKGAIIYTLCAIVPKKRNLWIFGSWFGTSYSDNTRYFFEYIANEKREIDAVWLTKSKTTLEKVRSLGYKAYLLNSPMGIWSSARSKYAFTTSFLQNVLNPIYISKRTKVFNLWHGTPLKVLGKDHNRNTESGKVKDDEGKKYKLKRKIFRVILPFVERSDDFFLTPSNTALKTLSSAFPGDGITKHFIAPYPRNMEFKKESTSKNKIIYMPTWRAYLGSSIDLFSDYGFDVDKISKVLEENNLELHLKLHKYSRIDERVKSSIESSKVIKLIDCGDIYEIINDYDILITDYSSIYFDYLYRDKPIIFTPFDLEDYLKNDHKMYYPYNEVTPGPKAYNWDEVTRAIVDFVDNPNLYKEDRERIHSRFNPIQAGDFNEHLFNKVMELTNER